VADTSPVYLVTSLRDFLDRLNAASPANPFVDVAAGERIVRELGRVLDVWDRLSPAQREQVTEAVDYVVTVDDEEHDLLSPIGLMDDEERVTALVAELEAVLDS